MLEVILDTETTGLSTAENHRILEIGCIEINNQIPTDKIFHHYINPQRPISEDAFKMHGYSEEFLSDKKKFPDIVDDFLDFIKDKKLIIHNASFDLSFLNHELKLLKREPIKSDKAIDTLELARSKFPGSQNSIDALCKRFKIDNSKRKKHSALLDCKLLLEIYINLVDQKEPKLNFDTESQEKNQTEKNTSSASYYSKKIIKPTTEELDQHALFLKSSLRKNYY